jgi:hypothetical protein
MTVDRSVAIGVVAPVAVVGSVLAVEHFGPKLFAEATARDYTALADRIIAVLAALAEPAFRLLIFAGCMALTLAGSMLAESA